MEIISKTEKKEKHQSSPNRIPTNINIFKVKCKTVSTNTKNCNKTGKDTETVLKFIKVCHNLLQFGETTFIYKYISFYSAFFPIYLFLNLS